MSRWDKAGSATIPDWFWRAVETPAVEDRVEVDECDVVFRRWGEHGKPSLLFVHGMYAHSHWWDFIAPQFMSDYSVAALDLTGMGDSDYRYGYSPETYAEEIVAVCDRLGFGSDVSVVAHSFGGMVMTKAANLHPERFGTLVLVDSGPRHPDEEGTARGGMMGSGQAKVYPDKATAIARFRLQPPQPCENAYILEYIARHSVMPVDGGWTWKFDEDLPTTMRGNRRGAEDYQNLQLPIGVIYGERSAMFSARSAAYLQELVAGDFPVVAIENAQHHVFLDQPEAFVAALREMLATLRTRR
jgi:pimeloyl-ACP methyl ester carboxylesterase